MRGRREEDLFTYSAHILYSLGPVVIALEFDECTKLTCRDESHI